MNLLTIGWWEQQKQKRFKELTTAGDFSVWPFASQSAYAESLARQRYLAASIK